MRSIIVAYTDSGLSIQPRRWALYRVQTNSRRPLDRLQLKYVFFCTLWPCNLDLWLFDLISMVDKGTARWYVVNRFPVFLVLRPSILPALAYDFLMSVRPDQLACISPTPRNSRSSKIHPPDWGRWRKICANSILVSRQGSEGHKTEQLGAVSYTHLTLPTIYSV